jgi:hypothetical protein
MGKGSVINLGRKRQPFRKLDKPILTILVKHYGFLFIQSRDCPDWGEIITYIFHTSIPKAAEASL